MTLAYLPPAELARLRAPGPPPALRARAFAHGCRINALYMVARAGSGHLGTSFSCLDLLSWLHLEVLGEGDRYFSSKGHDAPALYAVLLGLGRLDFALLHRLRRLDGLPGHPDVRSMPEVQTSTGSLGMGISKAKGFVRADRLAGRAGRRVYVLLGDGELQEGQVWESLSGAANAGMGEITAIVDRNAIQSDTWVDLVSDLGDLEAKVAAFGWAVDRCDGHDPDAIAAALARLDGAGPERPRLLIADTLKGAGVGFMEPHELPRSPEALYAHHSGAPSPDEYERALEELRGRLDALLAADGQPPVRLATAPAPERSAPVAARAPQRLIGAYAEALAAAGTQDPRVVVLDADLAKDCGLGRFRAAHPDRFVECGIAEQDMVSQAGALALAGLRPVVHSFACFLTARAGEQIFNNATEGTRVIYAGSLAGLVPAWPGHSHPSVRDVATMGSVPGMAVIEPGWESQVAPALAWALADAPGPTYLRLVSVPWSLPFEPPVGLPQPGRGHVLREGADACLVAAGPVMLGRAWRAADELAADGVECSVIALPWLRGVDGGWLAAEAGDGPVVCLDDHWLSGGLGDEVLAALAAAGSPAAGRVVKLGVDRIPACGTNDEVLRAHGFEPDAIGQRVRSELRALA